MTIFKIYHYNHQGSVALLTDKCGNKAQHLQYLPYGGIFVDHRTGSYSSPYTFSAKEKDAESGYNYFGARYYTDNIMMWLSVDPMSDERPNVSPYSYCQNNPIGRVDTWGMLDDDYEVNRKGEITKLNDNDHYDANGNEVDVIYNSDKSNSIQVSKNFMGSKKTQFVRGKRSNGEAEDYYPDLYSVTGDDKAKDIFEFMAQNTDVEWSQTKVGTNRSQKNFISTSHKEASEAGQSWLLSKGYTIRGHNHSHPYQQYPSDSDINWAMEVSQKFPNVELYIFHNGQYHEYNQYGYVGPGATVSPY